MKIKYSLLCMLHPFSLYELLIVLGQKIIERGMSSNVMRSLHLSSVESRFSQNYPLHLVDASMEVSGEGYNLILFIYPVGSSASRALVSSTSCGTLSAKFQTLATWMLAERRDILERG